MKHLERICLGILAVCVAVLIGLLVGAIIAIFGAYAFPILLILMAVLWVVSHVSSLDDF